MTGYEMRADISEVLVRYATGIDRRDWTLFRTCFTGDCQADYGDIGAWHDADSLTAWMEKSHARCGHTMHRITNQDITPQGEGATARSYVDAVILMADNQTGTHALGYYDDELVHSEQGWKIASRRFTMVLARPVLADEATLHAAH
jgi:3-phenylpropionate/cinnamic acid dioxygenase small subunit